MWITKSLSGSIPVDRILASALIIAAVATTACSSYRPAAASQAPTGRVRVTHVSPRTVVVRKASGEQVSVHGSTEIVGRADSTIGDTLYMRVHQVRGPQGLARGVPYDGMVTVVRDRDTVVEGRAYNSDRTMALLLGVPAILFAFFLALQSGGSDVVYY